VGAEEIKDRERGEVAHAWLAVVPGIGSGLSDSLYNPVNFPIFPYLKILHNSCSKRMMGMVKKKKSK